MPGASSLYTHKHFSIYLSQQRRQPCAGAPAPPTPLSSPPRIPPPLRIVPLLSSAPAPTCPRLAPPPRMPTPHAHFQRSLPLPHHHIYSPPCSSSPHLHLPATLPICPAPPLNIPTSLCSRHPTQFMSEPHPRSSRSWHPPPASPPRPHHESSALPYHSTLGDGRRRSLAPHRRC
jgi:hypothetical protein